MGNRKTATEQTKANVTIRISGKLFEGHLSYLDQLVESAAECRLWPLLSLSDLHELDRAAVLYLLRGEQYRFALVSCPNFVREWMDHERGQAAA
jgi:hypothetical protein